MRLLQVCLLTVVFAQGAIASGGRSPAPDREELPPMDHDISPVVINPESLRKRLFDENLDIQFASNNVHISKENVNLARSKTFVPELNLGAMLSSLANPSFILNSVELLLPFLMPSRWFDMFQQEQLLEADKKSYQILQLNTYASAYSLYVTIMNDVQLKDQFEQDLADWRTLEDTARVRQDLGEESSGALSFAIAQRALAETRVLNVRGLVVSELADLRRALGYHPDKPISLDVIDVPASEWEQSKVDPALQEAYNRSIEREQIHYLINASDQQRKSAMFSWIGGTSIATSANVSKGEKSPTFNSKDISVGTGLSFSWGIFPLISLAKLQTKDLKMRKTELERELARTLDVALNQYQIVLDRYKSAKEAEDNMRQSFDDNLVAYQLGELSLSDFISSRFNIADATRERIAAQLDLNELRITLHRTFRTDKFAGINGCNVPNTAENRKKYGIKEDENTPYCLPVQTN